MASSNTCLKAYIWHCGDKRCYCLQPRVDLIQYHPEGCYAEGTRKTVIPIWAGTSKCNDNRAQGIPDPTEMQSKQLAYATKAIGIEHPHGGKKYLDPEVCPFCQARAYWFEQSNPYAHEYRGHPIHVCSGSIFRPLELLRHQVLKGIEDAMEEDRKNNG